MSLDLDELEAMVHYVADGGRVYCDEIEDARQVLIAARGAGHRARVVSCVQPGEPVAGWIVEPAPEPWESRMRAPAAILDAVPILGVIGLVWVLIVLAWAALGGR